jgi:hypothetical protein
MGINLAQTPSGTFRTSVSISLLTASDLSSKHVESIGFCTFDLFTHKARSYADRRFYNLQAP